jgi:NADH-quinone oxidoreductase subunit D
MGVFLESDGGPKPYRVHYRTPSFANLQIMPLLCRGRFVADVVGIIGSIDIVLGDTDR